MNRFARMLCSALTLLILLTTFAMPACARVGETYFARKDAVRLRARPRSKETIARLSKGDVVLHVATKYGWWKVKSIQGITGYVPASSLKSTDYLIVQNGVYHVYRIDRLAVRQGPGSNTQKLGIITRGTPVKLLQKHDDWGGILLENGNTGWVRLKYLKYLYNPKD